MTNAVWTNTWQWLRYAFHLRSEDESPSAATTRRIVGISTVVPAVLTYVFALEDVTVGTAPAAVDAAAGALTGVAIALLPACCGRGIFVGVIAMFLVDLLRRVLELPALDGEKVVTTSAFILGAVAVCVHDLVKYPLRPKRVAARSAWHAHDETIELKACSACDEPVHVAPPAEEQEQGEATAAVAGTTTIPPERPLAPTPSSGALWRMFAGATAGLVVSALLVWSVPGRSLRRQPSPSPSWRRRARR